MYVGLQSNTKQHCVGILFHFIIIIIIINFVVKLLLKLQQYGYKFVSLFVIAKLFVWCIYVCHDSLMSHKWQILQMMHDSDKYHL